MPAAADIPAPISSTKVVAGKKLVVGPLPDDWPALWVSIWLGLGIFLESVAALDGVARYPGPLP